MVVRCSNEAPFVVLEPAPSVRTGIRVEVAHGDDPATVIDVLPDTWGRQWRDPLKGPGTGSFNVFADNPHLTANPGILDYGNIARFYLDETLRFAFLIEKKTVTVAGEGDDAARVINVSGRGVLAKLEESVVYLSDGLSGEVERTSAGFLNAGWWMEELLIESFLRGELTDVTRGFTFERDSNGALWEVPLLINERAGTDLLRVAERHAEVAVDVWMSPTLELNYFNERGIDRTIQTEFSAPVVLRPGHNIVELSADEDGVIRNVLLIETPAGWLERSDPASVAAYGRRVSYLSLGNVTDGGQVDRVADAIFARNAQPAPDLTLEITDVDDHRPYVSFGVGDWVLAPSLDGNLVKHRVRAINVAEDAEGRPRFPIELATVGDELETRMARWLEAMSRGTMGGVAGEVAEPTKAPSEVQAAALTIVETGVDEHVINDPHPATLNDLTDVDTATDPPADNEVLTYRTALGLWVPRPGGGGGGGGDFPAWLNAFADPPVSDPMDDDFADGVIAGKWTQRWVGSPAPTYAEDSALSTLWIDRGPINGWNLASLMQAAPSGDFTVETGIAISDHGGVNYHVPNMLIVSRAAGTSSDLYFIGWRPSTRELTSIRLTDYSSFVNDDVRLTYAATPLTRFRFRRQSGVWYFEFSNAGRTWYTLRQLAEPWVPAEVGIGINVENAGVGLSGGFRYFRRTA